MTRARALISTSRGAAIAWRGGLTVALVLGCAPGSSPSSLLEVLEDQRQDQDLVGLALAVEWADGSVEELAVGSSSTERDEAWTPDRQVRIGSVTKTFTAALTFLLVEEGVLSLDDPLETWVPGFYDDYGITLRHLLSNTSGIANYNWIGGFDDSAVWEPEELVQWAVDHEPAPTFAPGAQWEYSSTNFILLGLAAEAATGTAYEDLVQARLFEPLDLRDTYIAASADDNAAIVDCYDADGTNLTDSADPSFGWAAGSAVSTPADLARWTSALYGGELLSEDSMRAMTTQTVLTDGTTVDYGLGSFVETDGEVSLYGHSGGIAGYLTYAYYWETEGIALVVASNTLPTELRPIGDAAWQVLLD